MRLINLIHRLIPHLNNIQPPIHHLTTREHQCRQIQQIPQHRVSPIVHLIHLRRRTHKRRTQNDIYATLFHQGLEFGAQTITLCIRGPVLGYGELARVLQKGGCAGAEGLAGEGDEVGDGFATVWEE